MRLEVVLVVCSEVSRMVKMEIRVLREVLVVTAVFYDTVGKCSYVVREIFSGVVAVVEVVCPADACLVEYMYRRLVVHLSGPVDPDVEGMVGEVNSHADCLAGGLSARICPCSLIDYRADRRNSCHSSPMAMDCESACASEIVLVTTHEK